jgi:tetratricopeptide (TPR) repeat protein
LAALKAHKLGLDLYPTSDELLFNWGYFIILSELSPEGRAALKTVAGEYERPVVYFRRAFESNPDGVMSVKTFLDIGGRWLTRPQLVDAGIEYVGAGVALHPKDAALRQMLGDFLARKGRADAAAEHYRAAYNLDSGLGKGLPAEEYVSGRLKAAAEQKKN